MANQNLAILFLVITILVPNFTLFASAWKSKELEHEKAKMLAHDAITQGIREVKEIKRFINSLVKLKSIRYSDTMSTPQLFGCVRSVEWNMEELKAALYSVKHLRSSDFLYDYPQSMKHVMTKTKKSAKQCVNALKDVEDSVVITMVKRKFNDISLIVDDVVRRLYEFESAARKV